MRTFFNIERHKNSFFCCLMFSVVFIISMLCFTPFAKASSDQESVSSNGVAYMVFDGTNTLTLTPTRPSSGVYWQIQEQYSIDNLPEWCQGEFPSKIMYVKYDSTLYASGFKPTSIAYWFYGLSQLQNETVNDQLTIGFRNTFNTSQVVNAESFLEGCSSLINASLYFSSPNELSLKTLVKNCLKLETLLLQIENTNNLVETDMFSGCHMLYAFGTFDTPSFRFTQDCGFDFSSYSSQTGGTEWIFMNEQYRREGSEAPFDFLGKDATYQTFNSFLDTYVQEHQDNSYLLFFNGYFGPLAFVGENEDASLASLTILNYSAAVLKVELVNWNDHNPHPDSFHLFPITGDYDATHLPEWCQAPYKDLIVEALVYSYAVPYKPTSMAYWFYGLSNLTNVTFDFSSDSEYFPDYRLDTSQVESLASTFEGCSNLSKLDFDGFSTERLQNMDSMCKGCSQLSSINFSGVETQNVRSMNSTFEGCSSLDSLDLSSLETDSLTSMNSMFSGATKLNSLNLSSFIANTGQKSVSMNNAFVNTPELDVITLSTSFNFTDNTGFDFSAAKSWEGFTDIQHGGYGEDFDTDAKANYTSWNTFINMCAQAQPPLTPIYFTVSGGEHLVGAYMDFEDNSLFVRYGLINKEDPNEMEILTDYSLTNLPAWQAHAQDITKVVFTEVIYSADYAPQSMAYWFYGLSNLETVECFKYVKTQNLTSINSLFENDSSLKTLDFSKVTFQNSCSMKDAFKGTSSLSSFLVNNAFLFAGESSFPFSGNLGKFWSLDNRIAMPNNEAGWNEVLSTETQPILAFELANIVLTFNANGGDFDGSATYVVYGNEGEQIPHFAPPTYAGHTFKTWENEEHQPVFGRYVFPGQSVTYWAVWDTNVYHVTFDSKGGTEVPSQAVAYGSKVVKPSNPSKEGYSFSGWYKDESLSELWNFDTDTVSNDMTLYASWSPVPEPTPSAPDGWVQSNEGWQYVQNGVYLNDGWHFFDDEFGAHWYYFETNSYMLTSHWIWDDAQEGWYWVCSSGPMIEGIWDWIDNAWYGFWWGGKMCQGWVWDESYQAWFFCNEYTGRVSCNQWAWDGAWYYFDQNCRMLSNCWVDSYWLDEYGMWVH